MSNNNNNNNPHPVFNGKVAMVCASNQNRSMAAHVKLQQLGYKQVYSYGTGTQVRLPGKTLAAANAYPFGTPYESMYQDLEAKDKQFYTDKGILNMLDRNRKCKTAPQKWQHELEVQFDIVVTFENRVFDAAVEFLATKDSESHKVVHFLGLHVIDNHKAAEEGAELTAKLLSMIAAADDWEHDLDHVLESFQQTTGKNVSHAVLFY